MTRYKRILLTVLGVCGLMGLTGLQLAPAVYADPSTDAARASACTGIGGKMVNGKCETDSASIDDIIGAVINIFSSVVGVIAVIMIMVGGFKYITAGGDSGKLSGAKNTIVYAVVGLVIVAMAQFIVKYVVQKST